MVNPAKPSIKSFVKIAAEEVASNANAEICTFEVQCKLNDTGNLYFYIVYKEKGQNNWAPIYKSEVRKYGPNGFVTWNPCTLGCTDMCNDNVEQPIKIEFFRSSTDGKHKNLGNTMTT